MAQDVSGNIDWIESALLVESFEKRDGTFGIETRGGHISCSQSVGFHLELPAISGLARGGYGLAHHSGCLGTRRTACQKHHGEQTQNGNRVGARRKSNMASLHVSNFM